MATLTLSGVGVIVGAGIYVLIGRVAGLVDGAIALVFLLAAIAALPTGLSYAELASRYPRSAGESVYTDRAFRRPLLSFMVGYLVLCSGIASTAAVSHGFTEYLGVLIPLPGYLPELAAVAFLGALTLVNHRGIEAATWVNILCTVLSVGALIVLVAAAAPRVTTEILAASLSFDAGAPALLAGTALSFYAFIGFEDMCNVAEEVRSPHRTIPRAILVAMALVTTLYLAVGVAVVAVVPSTELGVSEAPLALVASRLFPSLPRAWLSVVALFAVTNTALVNLIMGSRILYGMARQGFVPRFFGWVHPVARPRRRGL